MQRIAAFALEMSSLTGTGILLSSGNVRQLAVVLQPLNESGTQLRQIAPTVNAGAGALAAKLYHGLIGPACSVSAAMRY